MLPDAAHGDVIDDHRFPCEVCGAELRYNPGDGTLTCDHCGHQEAILAPARGWQLAELDLRAALKGQLGQINYETHRVTNCNNCGASIEFTNDDHAKECAYCASPVVIDTGESRLFKPKGVIPFRVSEKQATDTLSNWLGKRWFAPSGLSQYARKGRAMNGVYIPFWTFDAQTQTDYIGQRGDVYYETVGHGENRRRVARVRWRGARGRVSRFFDDVLILASKALPREYTDELQPWDLSALEPYNPEFLAGYRAEAYSVTLEEGWQEAQSIMKSVITRDVKFDIGGDRQQISDMQTRMGELGFKHILLPIYTLAYKFRGKTYRCVINGQTGRVTGERPYSPWKIFFAILGLIVLTILFAFMAQNSGYVQVRTN